MKNDPAVTNLDEDDETFITLALQQWLVHWEDEVLYQEDSKPYKIWQGYW